MKFFQRLGRSLMLPVAVLPVAAILSGIGYWIENAVGEANLVSAIFSTAGGALLDNLALLFAIGVSIGMARKTDGTSALAGLVSWLVITTMLNPDAVAVFQGIEVDDVNPAFANIENAFTGIIAGLIGAACYNRFKDVKLPDWLSFFSGKRSVAIITAAASLILALILYFAWPFVYGGLVNFGEWIVGLGAFGTGIYGFLNRLLIPFGLHHALNSVFWFDVAGINDLNNFLAGDGTYGVTGQYMTGFFPIMMLGLPGAALAMYVTAKTKRKKIAAGILLSAAVSSFFVGVTEPLEFSFMFLAPWLYVVHALFTGISMAIATLLPVRMGFGFSGGFIDLVLGWVNPMAQNPWIIFVLGAIWFVIYFLVFRWLILRFQLKTPGREDDEDVLDEPVDTSDAGYLATGAAFIDALGGKENILELDNCATRLRMEIGDTSKVDEHALKRAGATGTMKPGGQSVQVIYGLNVQFVKDAMDQVMAGAEVPVEATPVAPAGGAVAVAAPPRAVVLRQPIAGTIVPLSEVPDEAFAQATLGPGVAVEPTGDTVVAPAAGKVETIFPTGHAVGLVLDDGTEVLIHIGLDTVEMNGDGFEALVSAGDIVDEGTPLVRVDLAKVRAAGHPTVTPIVVLNSPDAVVGLR